MRRIIVTSSRLWCVVLLAAVAFAQDISHANLKSEVDTAKSPTSSDRESKANNRDADKGEDLKEQAGKQSTPTTQYQTQATRFVEEFPPPADASADIPRPRIPLPVILDSDSPAFDRSIRREDLQSVPDDYVIGNEDVLTVTIWKERELSGSVVVRPDGKITVPLVGEIKVVGMTPLQLKGWLEERLKPFITVPQVSVAVNQINSRKVYLIGQVVREGAFPINSSMTVLQVLAGAGGLRDFAKKKKIYVLRKRGEEEIRFPFDYAAAVKGRNREENIRVEPGDTIVVP